MKLQTFLNKCNGNDILITVKGWCEELPFSEYEHEKQQDYWKNYKDKEVVSYCILTTNNTPELIINL